MDPVDVLDLDDEGHLPGCSIPSTGRCACCRRSTPWLACSLPLRGLYPSVTRLQAVLAVTATVAAAVAVAPAATAAVAGACNAVKAAPDGRLIGDMFDGEGFVRGAAAKGVAVAGRRALVVGCGGVGSAIAGSLARAGAGEIVGLGGVRGEVVDFNRFVDPVAHRLPRAKTGRLDGAFSISSEYAGERAPFTVRSGYCRKIRRLF